MNSENFRDTPQKSVVFAQSQIYGSVYDFIAKVKAENPVIDILVNNAGTILRAPGRSRAFAPDLGAHPRRTLGDASDIAGACVFLCSPASDYISGIVLPVDGGWLAR